jgi:putative YphP/YqiW family bacilliredoxin
MYPPEITEPCRKELTDIGVTELKTASDVDSLLKDHKGTALIVVNSVCGCAAGNARPGVRMALQHETLPEKLTTVFAGVDAEATEAARSYIAGYPPSSPFIALLKDGQPVFVLERHMIEGRGPDQIAFALVEAFDTHCG